MYDIELPMMLYNITVRLLQYEGKTVNVETGAEMTNWTTISTFFLTPSNTMGRSKDGKVNYCKSSLLAIPILLSVEFALHSS